MSADMLTAAIAVPADRKKPIDFERGRRMVEETADPESFRFDDPESQLEELIEDFDPDVHLDADGEPTPEVLKTVGRRIIDELEKALGSSETDTIEVAGYRLNISGGLSSGDTPTDAAAAIWNAYHLPVAVLLAMGFIPDCSRPLSRTNGNPGHVTDTDIVDAIALGLGTKPEWSGADELEWIANAVGTVRSHPGDRDPAEYHVEFTEQHGFDPVNDSFLIGYVSKYDDQEGRD
ncbi:hypothetical protein ACFVVC_02225 [Pseudarthrobacter sp. NPDC058196]|uniref:hypothetical protein n=1 Tax=Pseudarthrobacter sp. NPDC058196 TaxID=3346376 RepID=UPI0036DF2BD1